MSEGQNNRVNDFRVSLDMYVEVSKYQQYTMW